MSRKSERSSEIYSKRISALFKEYTGLSKNLRMRVSKEKLLRRLAKY